MISTTIQTYMNHKLPALLLMLISFGNVQAQSNIVPDALMHKICKAITDSRETNDSVKVSHAFAQYLYPVLEKQEEEKAKEAFLFTYYRLQKLCGAFKAITDKYSVQNGDWQNLDVKPPTQLTKSVCQQLLQHKRLYYLEANGDTVELKINKGEWTDRFKDGTYSKLKFYWVNDCEFEISFVESNNISRKSFSKPGDKYRYQLIQKYPGFYDVSVEIKEHAIISRFRIYYE